MISKVKSRFTGLWLHAKFRRLWAGQASSLLATTLTNTVLPLVAVVFLNATPVQMGVIGAMSGVPAIVGLFLGVWVDRRPRGPIMVMVDLGRMLLLLSVPLAHVFGALTIELLYVVALGIGAMSMLFEIAYRSFLPSVVGRAQLVEANAKLEIANSGAVAVGPGIGGLLVEWVTAPFAAVFGAAMYLLSAIWFRSLRVDEGFSKLDQDDDEPRESMLGGIKAGFGFFRGNRSLVGLTTAASTLVFFGTSYETIFVLYLVRNLDFTPAMYGVMGSLGSVGLFAASFISTWLTEHIGVGKTLVFGFLFMAVGGFLVPLAEGTRAVVFIIVIFAEITFVLGVIVWNIGQVSLRQAITPENLLGRVTSLQIVAARAVMPFGALLGGFLGELIGLREAIFVFAGGMAFGAVFLFVFGVWRIGDMPEVESGG